MKKTIAVLAVIAASVTTVTARAEVGIASEVGTTGIGFHAGVPLRPDLNARFGLGYLGYSYEGSTRDMDYELKLKANTYDALLDWFPYENRSFRLTTGLAYNGNKIDVRAQSNAIGSYTIGGNVYNAASVGTVTGKVSFNKVAPYLGIGWGRPSTKEKGWSFSTDVGVLFQGSPKTSMNNTGCIAPSEVCTRFANDIARENEALKEEVDRFKLYPVLRIGLNYKF